MYLGNILKDFTANNMKKETGLNGCVKGCFVDYDIIHSSNIIDIYKFSIKKHDIK